MKPRHRVNHHLLLNRYFRTTRRRRLGLRTIQAGRLAVLRWSFEFVPALIAVPNWSFDFGPVPIVVQTRPFDFELVPIAAPDSQLEAARHAALR